MLSVMM